ncbi:MAG TPA: PfkB family carbohydrate kinase [Propionibacteriaceae bacterium]|nr:PfkB family carbohydrate kinase [Propionibacteriaceae bacterium]
MSRFDVAGVGSASMDDLLYVDASQRDDKGRIEARERQPGGNIATALVAAAALGARVAFVGRLSDRDDGATVRADLASHGVDLQFALPDSQARPVRATIVVYKHGERFIAFDDSTTIGLLPGDDITPLLQARIVLLDNYALVPTLAALGPAASQVVIVADVEAQVDSAALHQVQHLVLPMSLGRQLSGQSDPAAIVNVLWNDQRTAVVLTDGEHGAWFRDATRAGCQHQSAFDVAAVDTTGCGDVFHGAYAAALARGLEVSECVRFAAAAGAICATGRGGRGRLPTEQNVLRIMTTIWD